jgi:hypothetical protein
MPKHLSSRAIAASALAALLAWPQPAMAEPFCDFLKSVMAARADGFAGLRGPARGKPEDKQYEGKLKVQADAHCTASPADVEGRPYYSCGFGKYSRIAQGEPLYYDFAGQLRRCFPATVFRETRTEPKAGDPFPGQERAISGIVDGYEVRFHLSNLISALAWLAAEMAKRKDKPPISFNMNVDVRRTK